MSNVKDIEIAARLPWDWATHLTGEDAQLVAGLFLNRVSGVKLEQADDGEEPNATGGRTAMVLARIEGTEALPWPFLDRLVAILSGAGTVLAAAARDIECVDSGWSDLLARSIALRERWTG